MIDLQMTTAEFVADYYEKQFLVRRGALTGSPVTWRDINTALFAWDPRDGLLQMFKDGPVPAERYTESFLDIAMQRSKIVKDVFYDLLRDGATLVLNRLETKSEAVHDITMEIARFVGERAVANGYVAFGGSGTFAKHWDTHDVFAVQLIGRKRWRVFAPTFPLPLPHQKSKEHKHECPADPVFNGYLEAGDVLYIPRGWWHEATPLEDQETLHLAVGIHPMRLTDYIAWSCFKTLPSAVELRQSVKAEVNDMTALREGVRTAQELLGSEASFNAYKQEVIASERVVSRFSLEALGRTESFNASGEFRLNSAYRTTNFIGKVSVNGQAISIDDISRKHLAILFSQARSSLNDISQSTAPRAKTSILLAQLRSRDIISSIVSG